MVNSDAWVPVAVLAASSFTAFTVMSQLLVLLMKYLRTRARATRIAWALRCWPGQTRHIRVMQHTAAPPLLLNLRRLVARQRDPEYSLFVEGACLAVVPPDTSGIGHVFEWRGSPFVVDYHFEQGAFVLHMEAYSDGTGLLQALSSEQSGVDECEAVEGGCSVCWWPRRRPGFRAARDPEERPLKFMSSGPSGASSGSHMQVRPGERRMSADGGL